MSRKEKPGYSEETNHESNPGLPIEIIIGMTESIYPVNLFNKEIKSALKQIGVDPDLLNEIDIKPSPDGVSGDFGFHCVPFAKRQKRNPVQIAQELSQQMPVDPNGLLESYEAV